MVTVPGGTLFPTIVVGSLPRPLPAPASGCQHDVCTGNGVGPGVVMAKGNLEGVANIGQGCRPDAPLRPCEMNCADESLRWRTQAIPRAARVQDTLVERPVVRDQEVRRGDPRPQAGP